MEKWWGGGEEEGGRRKVEGVVGKNGRGEEEGEGVAREEGGWCFHVYLRDCIFTISPHVLLRNKGDVTLASITAAAATQLMDKVSHMYMYANL